MTKYWQLNIGSQELNKRKDTMINTTRVAANLEKPSFSSCFTKGSKINASKMETAIITNKVESR